MSKKYAERWIDLENNREIKFVWKRFFGSCIEIIGEKCKIRTYVFEMVLLQGVKDMSNKQKLLELVNSIQDERTINYLLTYIDLLKKKMGV